METPYLVYSSKLSYNLGCIVESLRLCSCVWNAIVSNHLTLQQSRILALFPLPFCFFFVLHLPADTNLHVLACCYLVHQTDATIEVVVNVMVVPYVRHQSTGDEPSPGCGDQQGLVCSILGNSMRVIRFGYASARHLPRGSMGRRKDSWDGVNPQWMNIYLSLPKPVPTGCMYLCIGQVEV